MCMYIRLSLETANVVLISRVPPSQIVVEAAMIGLILFDTVMLCVKEKTHPVKVVISKVILPFPIIVTRVVVEDPSEVVILTPLS